MIKNKIKKDEIAISAILTVAVLLGYIFGVLF